MPKCKKCGSESFVKNGSIGGQQRYRCNDCGCNFRCGDRITNDRIAAKYTSYMERDNSNTRHNFGRFTRKTQVVSHLEHMVDITLCEYGKL